MENEKLTKEHQLNYLSVELNRHESLTLRKETAAWSFIIFYVASIWTFYNSFIEDKTAGPYTLIFSLIVVVLIGYIAFQFVHSQYASIYYRLAFTLAVEERINDLIQENNDVKNSNLRERQSYYLEEIQPFRGKNHPLKIFLRFWHNLPYLLYPKKRKELRNPAKHEASLYSIIILVTIAYGYLVWQLFCNIPPK